MSSSVDAGVYVNGDFSEPMSAQHNFRSQFDLNDPMQAMATYSRMMHQHTKSQMDLAARSSRRRSESDGRSSMSSLRPESSNGSYASHAS